jgi:phenylpropionate dioxygenase-like ring-hydroxylating dioxygenase large terminal subunit
LIFVPAEEGFPDFDKSCRSLKEVPLVEAHGLIWVNPNLEGNIDLPNFLGNIADDLDNFELKEGHYFKQSSHTCKANWKLLVEAFQDGYHVTRLHKKTVGEFFIDNMAVQEREKQHIRSIVARKGIEEAMQLPKDKWDFRQHGSFSHFIWPNTTTIMHPDYISQVTFYPIGVDKTIIIHNCVIEREPQSEKELAHFERSFELIDKGVFSTEDFYVCEQAQIGMKSGANDTFVVGGYEAGLRAFHQILQESVGTYRDLSSKI